MKKNYNNILSRFDRIPKRRRTDRQTDRGTDRIAISISRVSIQGVVLLKLTTNTHNRAASLQQRSLFYLGAP